ncbi:MAG: SMP-30/gluconolactonase/LRE family protein [Nocardioides sp.]|jgi:sugar lactone lactonase YvrE
MRKSPTVLPVPAHGAEDVLVLDGCVYTGTEDGSIWRIDPRRPGASRVGHTAGRPLGIEAYGDDLLICDAHRGLLLMAPGTGSITAVASSVDGVPMRFCNNAAVAEDSTIYFTDSSAHFGIQQWKDDFVQDTRTGRLLRRDADGNIAVLHTGLAFANGVALAADESYVAFAETRGRRIGRHWLTGERTGRRDDLVTDLPGYPDNIARGSDGLVWITIASPTDPVVERLGTAPLAVRKAVTRIPEALQPKPKRTVRVQAYDDGGRLVHDLDLPADGYHMATGVREDEGRVWLGSLHEPAVAYVDLP